jgi:hypothetical protein
VASIPSERRGHNDTAPRLHYNYPPAAQDGSTEAVEPLRTLSEQPQLRASVTQVPYLSLQQRRVPTAPLLDRHCTQLHYVA